MFRDYFPVQRSDEPKLPITKRIAAFYGRQFEFIKRMKRHMLFSALIFLLTTVIGTLYFLLRPEIAVKWMENFRAEWLRLHPEPFTQWGLFLHIFKNNLRIFFYVCMYGLFPFYLPVVIFLILNTGVLAMIFVYGLIQNEPVAMQFLTLILPHGMIEFPTMIFVAGFSLYISAQMTKRLFRKKIRPAGQTSSLFKAFTMDRLPDYNEAFVDILYMFASVILPLTLIAVLIETFITPVIYRLFG